MRPSPAIAAAASRLLLVLLAQTAAAAATAAAQMLVVNNNSSRLSCSEALHHFLGNLSWTYHSEEHSLAVQGPPDDDFPVVCGTDHYSIELWRAITVPGSVQPADFGTKEYFSMYQNCDNPNIDLLWKHGDSIRASVISAAASGNGVSRSSGQSRQAKIHWTSTDRAVFYHVVEQQYMLRICPCSNNSGVQCSCEHAGQGSATCSEVFNISSHPHPHYQREKVFPWCRGDGTPAPRPQLSAPKLQHCPAQVMLSGTLPSCTPVRDYDKVEVVLQPMAYEVEDCKELPREAAGRLAKLVPLTAINDTHGMFHVAIGNITHETFYCLRVELVKHPYCNSGSDHTLTRQPAVCRAVSLKKPIFIEDHVCGRPDPCEPPKPNLPLITGVSLAAAVLLAVALVMSHRVVCRRRRQSEQHRQLGGGRRPHDLNGMDRLLLLAPSSPQHPDIFFLYWGDSADFVDVNRLVGRWLTGLGHKVLDLNDELLQEELASCPEIWLQDRLADSSVKVIVVESELANECLRLDVAGTPPLPSSPLMASLAAAHHHTVTDDDGGGGGGGHGLDGLLNHQHQYHQQTVVRNSIDELRAYSLRFIHAQLAANYRRLCLVKYRSGGLGGPLASLVPHTRHTLPEHLAELQAWLADTQAWDDNSNLGESAREQTLRDLKAAVQKYTAACHLYKGAAATTTPLAAAGAQQQRNGDL